MDGNGKSLYIGKKINDIAKIADGLWRRQFNWRCHISVPYGSAKVGETVK